MIFSIRHPIPVTLSREVFPRLASFVHSEYSENFNKEQIAFAKDIIAHGTQLEKGVVDWCFQNAPLLRYPHPDLLLVTYEELTLNPAPVINRIAAHLALNDTSEMLNNVNKPSNSVSKSNRETAAVLGDSANYEANKQWLIEKWRKKVAPGEEEKLMEILKVFELDIYASGDLLPHKKYWINQEQFVKI
jgi:hypothetical protein